MELIREILSTVIEQSSVKKKTVMSTTAYIII
jgi:hypothetical protein